MATPNFRGRGVAGVPSSRIVALGVRPLILGVFLLLMILPGLLG
jgi:hypothetical protein